MTGGAGEAEALPPLFFEKGSGRPGLRRADGPLFQKNTKGSTDAARDAACFYVEALAPARLFLYNRVRMYWWKDDLMREEDLDRYIDMSLPADRDMMLVARLTASGVLARAGLTVDALDDLKMAVEESLGLMMAQIASPGRVALRYELGKCRMIFTCECEDGCLNGKPIDPTELEVARCILASLVDAAEVVTEDGVIRSIRLKMALPR